MARFGRKETFIAPHYAHGFPTSPVGFHPLQPLNWGPYVPYGTGAPYGSTSGWWKSALQIRYTHTELQSRGANVAVYDLYDAVIGADVARQLGRALGLEALDRRLELGDLSLLLGQEGAKAHGLDHAR